MPGDAEPDMADGLWRGTVSRRRTGKEEYK